VLDRKTGPSCRRALKSSFRERQSNGQLEFRAEGFNLFNTPLFQGVSRTLGSATFGRVTSSQYERELQMGLKIYF
jgi:hypothetical protein